MKKPTNHRKTRTTAGKPQHKRVSKRASIQNDKFRFYVMWGITLLCFIALLGKAFWLQIIKHEFYEEKASKAIISTRIVQPNRGVIYDRHGTPLALSTPMNKISFNAREYSKYKLEWEKAKKNKLKNLALITDPKVKEDLLEDIEKKDQRFDLQLLATATNVDIKKIQATMLKKSPYKNNKKIMLPISQYYILAKNIPPKAAEVILKRRFVGVHKETEYKRFYPQPQPNAQVLGFMGRTNGEEVYKGRAGLERLYNHRLAGTAGKVSVIRGAKEFGAVDDKLIKDAETGENLVTSLDGRLQYILYRELEKAGRMRQARSASGMVVDTRTGEVLAMSNWPSFNSNNLNERTNQNERNRAAVDSFEPGSVVKPLTVVAALESGKFHKNSVLHTGGRIKIHSKVFNDHCGKDISLTKLISCSSNTASIKIGQILPRDGIANMYLKLGLGNKTSLNFPSEQAGIVVAPTKKQLLKRANMTFGYAIETTLVQLTQAYSIIANDGKLIPFTFEKQTHTPTETTQIISQETANDVLTMMQSITKGTGKRAAIPGYSIAGKTGTAKKILPNKKGYYEDKYRALFIGIAPATNPRFITAIVVEDPVGDYGGGKVAAPIFKNVMQEALRLNNIPMDKKY